MDEKTAAASVPNGIYWDWSIDRNAYVVIQVGTGMGQARLVQSPTATTITVADDWRIPPSSDSKITLGILNHNIIIYRNEMNAFPQGFRNCITASCAFQLDGNTWFSVGEANISRRTSGTVPICAAPTSPSCWNDVRGHRGYDAWFGAALTAWVWENSQTLGNHDIALRIAAPLATLWVVVVYDLNGHAAYRKNGKLSRLVERVVLDESRNRLPRAAYVADVKVGAALEMREKNMLR